MLASLASAITTNRRKHLLTPSILPLSILSKKSRFDTHQNGSLLLNRL
jgi:hypothetical protein